MVVVCSLVMNSPQEQVDIKMIKRLYYQINQIGASIKLLKTMEGKLFIMSKKKIY